jgi:predicted DNA-binding ribbon-helix-helix protein
MGTGRSKRQGQRRGGAPLVSVRLDPALWQALHEIAARQGRPVRDLVSDIARDSLAVAIRVYVEEFRRAEEGGCDT